LENCCSDYEIWVIDDGSDDATWANIGIAQKKYSQLSALKFTRNFGKEAAILAGLRHACGKAVVVMDADGQHPPTVLPTMLELWKNNKVQIVAAQKSSRNTDKWSTRLYAHLFNRLMKTLTGLDLTGASDFRLLDRCVVDALLAFPEKVRFFRGMTIWTGYSTATLGFDVAPRIAGQSQWSRTQLTRLAIVAITSFSAKPLGMIFRLGLLGVLASIVILMQAIYSWMSGIAVSGWTSLTVVILLFGSANLLGIGVLGAYLAQIFDEIKKRPEYLVSQSILNTHIPNRKI
jgi:glycosyltransferase involved in cell wall biosynthesis